MLELTCFGPLAILALFVILDALIKRSARPVIVRRVDHSGRVLSMQEHIEHGGI